MKRKAKEKPEPRSISSIAVEAALRWELTPYSTRRRRIAKALGRKG